MSPLPNFKHIDLEKDTFYLRKEKELSHTLRFETLCQAHQCETQCSVKPHKLCLDGRTYGLK